MGNVVSLAGIAVALLEGLLIILYATTNYAFGRIKVISILWVCTRDLKYVRIQEDISYSDTAYRVTDLR